VRQLLDEAADVSAAGEKGWTPLHFASDSGHEAVACLLLDRETSWVEAAALGAGDEAGDGQTPTVRSHPPVHGTSWRGVGVGTLPLGLSFLSFLCDFFGTQSSFLAGQAWAEGKRGACDEPPCADCGQETDCKYSSP